MYKHKLGFTIVELLIVIVVIGILAAIVIVSYTGIQQRGQNTQKGAELKSWQKIFETYRTQVGDFPAMANGDYCLGTGFLVGGGGVARCRDYLSTGATSYIESGNTALMTELAKVATLPKPSNLPASGTLGPYATYTATQIILYGWFKGASTDCPAGTINSYTDIPNYRIACTVTINK